MSVFFPFGTTSAFQFDQDLVISDYNPGLIFRGLEANAQWSEVREVAGALWQTQNAQWNGSGWVQVAPTLNSYAVQRDAAGNTNWLAANTGAPNPIVWTTVASISNLGVFSGIVPGGSVVPGTLPPSALSAPVPISLGGTGSATQTFVDITSAQTVAGAKTFTGKLSATAPGGINPQWYNVLDYGAVGDGVTNDLIAIQSAISAAKIAGGGRVFLPRGAAGSYFIKTVTATTTSAAITAVAVGLFPVIATTAALPYGYYFISDGTNWMFSTVEAGGGTMAPTIFINMSSGATINSGATITYAGLGQMPTVSFEMESGTELVSDGTSGTVASSFGFGGYNFNGETYVFGRISSFNGQLQTYFGGGIMLQDSTSYARVTVTEFFNCGFNVQARSFGTGGIFGHIVTWTVARQFIYGVLLYNGLLTTAIQGNYFGGPGAGLIANAQAPSFSIYLLSAVSGSVSLVSSNIFDIPGINGNNDVAWGIVFDRGQWVSGNVFRHINSFGSFATGRYIYCVNGATIEGQYFELGVYEFPGTVTGTTTSNTTIPAVGSNVVVNVSNTAVVNTFQYYISDGSHIMLCTALSGGGTMTVTMRCDAVYATGTIASGSNITNGLGGNYTDFSGLNGGQPANVMMITGQSATYSGMFSPTYYLANTASNTRSTFNGGMPLFFKRMIVACSLPALSAGGTADFYVYSPFTTGVQKQPKFQVQQMNCNAVLDIVEDESVTAGADGNGPVANQIHIRFRAFGTVTASTVVYGVLELCS